MVDSLNEGSSEVDKEDVEDSLALGSADEGFLMEEEGSMAEESESLVEESESLVEESEQQDNSDISGEEIPNEGIDASDENVKDTSDDSCMSGKNISEASDDSCIRVENVSDTSNNSCISEESTPAIDMAIPTFTEDNSKLREDTVSDDSL